MNSYVLQSGLHGGRPVVGNHLNVPKPAPGEPTLLTWREVTTMFHEFGHALHGMLSAVRYPLFSGTNVPRDFVEYPSQINEMWAEWPEVLENYARHWQTDEPMPAALLEKFTSTQKFNQGYATSEYLAAAILDQRWHQLTPEQVPDDVAAFEAATLRDVGLDYAPVPPRYRSAYFSHIFAGGYSAAYYAYIWSEVMDADSADWIARHGGLTRANGDRFRQYVLARGGSADMLQMFIDFQGRKPVLEPLLQRRGLTTST
jgi:peptidyl-dipeptidase Dcp